MKKILELIKKYYIGIIVFLCIILLLKSCQSCTRNNTIEYNKHIYENSIDSLNEIIKIFNDSILLLNNNNIILNNELQNCKKETERIISINKQYQRNNNKLINKLTEKENYEKH